MNITGAISTDHLYNGCPLIVFISSHYFFLLIRLHTSIGVEFEPCFYIFSLHIMKLMIDCNTFVTSIYLSKLSNLRSYLCKLFTKFVNNNVLLKLLFLRTVKNL